VAGAVGVRRVDHGSAGNGNSHRVLAAGIRR
jgi:hypothetical protein